MTLNAVSLGVMLMACPSGDPQSADEFPQYNTSSTDGSAVAMDGGVSDASAWDDAGSADGGRPDAASPDCPSGYERRQGVCQPILEMDCQGYPQQCTTECASGHSRVGDGPCRPTCSVTLGCPSHAHCEDVELPARCVCDPGYEGETCSACAHGFAPDSQNRCVPQLQSGWVLTAVTYRGNNVLAALDPTTESFVPIRYLARGSLGSIVDALIVAPDHTVYATVGLGPFGVGRDVSILDLAAAGTTKLAQSDWSHPITHTPLAFHPSHGLLYSLGTGLENYPLVTVAPVGGNVTVTTQTTPLNWAHSISVDTSNGDLVVLNNALAASMHRVNAETGETTNITFRGSTNTSNAYGAVAYDAPRSRVFLATSQSLSLLHWCRQTSRRLGYAIGDDGPGRELRLEHNDLPPGGSYTLTTQHANGPELLAVVHGPGDTSDAPVTVRVESSNPDAGLCVFNSFQLGTLTIAAEARFAFMVIIMDFEESAHSPLLVVEDGFVPPAAPAIHVAPTDKPDTRILDASWAAHPQWVRMYSDAEWSDRRLPRTYQASTGAVDVLEVRGPTTWSWTRRILVPANLWSSLAVWP